MKRTVVAMMSLAAAIALPAPALALDLSPERLTLVDVPSVVPAGTDSSVASFVPRDTSCRLVLRDAAGSTWKGPRSRASTGFLQFPWNQTVDSTAGQWRTRIKCRDTITRWKSPWSTVTVTSVNSAGAAPVIRKPYSSSVSTLSAAYGWQPFGTTLVRGTDWFNGRGVDVRSNGGNGCASGCAMRGTYGTKYQCVELVNRFVRTQGWVSSNILGNAHQILNNAPADAFDKHPAGDGYIPVPGDIIVWTGGSSGYGHVAVVSGVTATEVTFVEQNASKTGVWKLKMDSTGRLARYGALNHLGYLHAHANV